MAKYIIIILLFNSCARTHISGNDNNDKYNNAISILDFGAIPNDNRDDSESIQKAIDYAIKMNKTSLVYCPPGIYDLSNGVVVANQIENGEFFFVTITLTGQISGFASDQSIGKSTVFKLNNPTFGIALQGGRNCVIENIVFEGCAKYTSDPVEIMNRNINDWGSYSGAITNAYSPSCAIAIDPFHKNVPFKDQYKKFQNFYKNISTGGSSMILIKGCSFYKHYIAIANNPSANIANGDNIRAEDCHVSNCHTFWAAGQNQSRANSIENVYGLFLHTFVSNNDIGSKDGTPPTISNVNLAGFCKQVFDIRTAFSGLNVYRCYFEMVWSLGVSMGLSTSFDQCQFSFANPSTNFYMPPFQLYTNNSTSFRDCNIQYFSNCTIPMPFLFRSESLLISGGSIEGGVVVADGITNAGGDDLHKVTLENVKIKCLGKVAGKKSSEKPGINMQEEIIMGGEVILTCDDELIINSGTTYTIDNLGSINIKENENEKTAVVKDFKEKFKIGDIIFTDTSIDPSVSGFIKIPRLRSYLGYISSINRNYLTLSGIPQGIPEGKVNAFVVKYPVMSDEVSRKSFIKYQKIEKR